ncbi:MAG TPA: PilZ domain-containing protein [Oligoflexus sp.]|uniref:PilZ domain-containing protein n=1 Tax=Oligoflexus sp. TaxID=1971216 RepID=UPI002D642BF7|nr:PilZ domain-containing protein [Oligoflexus sp.]HYX32440.1 PilZ domain-containing protein [Oligoflexus sp.]
MIWRRLKKKRKSERLQQTLKLPMPWLECRNQHGASIEGEILDISEHGFCLRAPKEIEKGTILTVTVKDRNIRAQVKWCDYVKSEGLFRCGVELMDSDSRFLEEIARVWSVGD